MFCGPGHKLWGGLARTPQDSVSDSQNSAGGGCDQGISRSGHCQLMVAPNPLLLGTRGGSLIGRGVQGLAFRHTCPRDSLFLL